MIRRGASSPLGLKFEETLPLEKARDDGPLRFPGELPLALFADEERGFPLDPTRLWDRPVEPEPPLLPLPSEVMGHVVDVSPLVLESFRLL